MEKTTILLPNGTELTSGEGTTNAILSATFTESVNTGTELTLGSVCANMLEVTLISPGGGLSLEAGSEITVYREDASGIRRKKGIYILEKPVRSGANRYKLTAYDRVTKLDQDLTHWLNSLTQWPYPLHTFASMVCDACGLTLATAAIPNGDYPVAAFSAGGITGRQLMVWVGEACARFCRANTDGQIELAWYTPAEGEVTPSGDHPYFQGSLSYEDYAVAPIEMVHIRQTENDVGAVYPEGEGERNAYRITGNYLLTASTTAQLTPVAQAIYHQLQGVTYTPCTLSVVNHRGIEAGNILQITDANGNAISTYVMEKVTTGQKAVLESTGSHRRDSSTATNSSAYRALSGKLLAIQKGVEGLKLENRETDQKVATLEIHVDGVSAQVSSLQDDNAKQAQEAVSHTSLAQFHPVINTGIDLRAYLVATQSGTGDPSPDNVRPIHGIEELDVTVCGGNLLDTSGGLGWSKWNPLVIKAGQTYTITACATGGTSQFNIKYKYADGKTGGDHHLISQGQSAENGRSKTRVADKDIVEAFFYDVDYLNARKGVTVWAGLGAEATAYTPYTSQTETVRLPAPSYGGYVDWARGKYVQTHGYIASYNGETVSGDYISSTGGLHTGSQIVYELAAPIVYDLGSLPALRAPWDPITLYHNGNGGIELRYNLDFTLCDNIQNAQAAADKAQTTANGNTERLAALEINTNGIRGSVTQVQTDLAYAVEELGGKITAVEETASLAITKDQVKAEVRKEITENGTAKVVSAAGTFDENGLLIEKSGSPLSTRIWENGMRVYDAGDTVLEANDQGVDARNLHATTFLIMGEGKGLSRFEEYEEQGSKRMGCFWIGG